VWRNAEAIIDDTDADVLVIFDCCDAGILGRGRSQKHWPCRRSEFLGATSANSTTPIPGVNSFTSGLISALEDLSGEARGFTTSELRQKIIESPDFPENQIPGLYERRGFASLNYIVIAPVPVTDPTVDMDFASTSEDEPETVVDYLDLRILMDEPLDEDKVENISKLFKNLIKDRHLPARRVCLLDTRQNQILRAAAKKWMDQTLRRTQLSPLVIPNISAGQFQPPSPISSVPGAESSVVKFEKHVSHDEDKKSNCYIPILLFAVGGILWNALVTKGRLDRFLSSS
jgi:hypothetical protein